MDVLPSYRLSPGIIPAVPWIETMTTRKIAAAKDAEKKKRKWLHLNVALPRFDSRVVYCEVGGDTPIATGLMLMDPEIHFNENYVEKKHTKMARYRRRGDDKDLKPNPAIRDQLTSLTKRCE